MPSCFIDGSLCLQLTQYQHLASENSLGSTSIIQPSCTKGTGREGRINLVACRCRWNYQPVCERKASRLSVHSVTGWTRRWEVIEGFGGRQIGRQADNVYCGGGEQLHINMGWCSYLSLPCNKKLKLSSRCRWCRVMVQHTCTTL